MTRKRKPDQIERFKAFVVERGGELLVETNEWELVRFRGGGVTSVMYTNKSRRYKFTGLAQNAWDAFIGLSPNYRVDLRTPEQSKRQAHRDVRVRTLIERDGDVCFYCGDDFIVTGKQRTREHLVARTHDGPDHISNSFLSCPGCNTKAGHLSAPEKIRMRDRMRRGRGSKLLARAYDRMIGGEADPPLFDEIVNFLHESQPKEETQCPENSKASTRSTNCSTG